MNSTHIEGIYSNRFCAFLLALGLTALQTVAATGSVGEAEAVTGSAVRGQPCGERETSKSNQIRIHLN